jgi:anti-sigma-K factor RskA
MTDDTTPLTEDDATLAAEYVLRLLDPDAMAEAEARIGRDPAFAAEVRRWQENLAPLALGIDEVRPSPAAKDALMARVFEDDQRTGAPRTAPGLFQRWRSAFLSGLAAVIVVFALFVYPVTEPGPTHVAELQPAARDFVLAAALLMGDAPQLDLTRMDGPVAPDGRATELWAIRAGGAPVSLGVLPEEESWVVTLPPELATDPADLTLALSDEPAGGSPTGAPTGEVLATGSLDPLQ